MTVAMTSCEPGFASLEEVLAGAEAGIALFDNDFRLITCNVLYRDLCGYDAAETAPGASMADLIRRTLERLRASPDKIEETISRVRSRLRPGVAYGFRFSSPSGRTIEIHRRRLSSGRVVETVREVDGAVAPTEEGVTIESIVAMTRSRMMHALDVMADGFCLYNANDQLTVYNRKYVEFNPHIADLIVPGARFEEMLAEGVRRGGFNTHGMPADEFVRWRVEQHRNPSEPYDVQLADGRWIRVHEKRMDDGGIVGIRSDVTEPRLRQEEVLRMSQELRAKNLQFDTALNNMIQGLCMFDREQTLVVCNRRYLEMYGFSPEVVKPGIKLREILEYSASLGNYTPEEAERQLAERPDPARLRQRLTIKQRLKDGRVIAVMNEPMPDGGSIATCQDITDLERHEEQLQSYTRRLEFSNRELQDFAYVASHDLQEPLRKIEAFGSRLVARFGHLLPDDGRDYLDRMQNAAGRMRHLIEDLLTYSRVTTKASPFGEVDLEAVVEAVLSDLQIRIEETAATVEVGELPRLTGDKLQLGLLMQNLIGNALKFVAPDRRPVVRVSAESVPPRPHDPDDLGLCRITVADNGIGFDNKYKNQIFTIFQRLHGRREYEGTGVGLATCRKIVERHRGTIDADGRPGEGATFTVALPMRQPDSEM